VKVFATYNIKGGVGKTSAAVNVAYLAASEGQRTLLWDLDPQGAATYLFRIKSGVPGGAKALVRGRTGMDDPVKATDYDNLDLLPADFSYRNMDLALDHGKSPTRRITELLATVAADYDVVFLDCPPSVSLVSESVLRATDALLVPLIPTTLAVRTYDQLIDFVAAAKAPRPAVLAFFSMVDRRKKLHRESMAALRDGRPGIADAAIPAAAVVENMGPKREPVVVSAPSSEAARAYVALWLEARGLGRPGARNRAAGSS
jgi:chromosome partitioning protein